MFILTDVTNDQLGAAVMSIQGGEVWVDDLGRGASNVACNMVGGCGFLEIGRAFALAGA
ncbi:hypothetical protein [Acetobacter sp. DsW_063]|uniref:hypothetical protein n=1 Tax=Acetobacter sp. DsW_063 TaxID=1514894 RepID=UPI001302E56B|nr:hypothetical protein [Acetobacter sp. DsW_063]